MTSHLGRSALISMSVLIAVPLSTAGPVQAQSAAPTSYADPRLTEAAKDPHIAEWLKSPEGARVRSYEEIPPAIRGWMPDEDQVVTAMIRAGSAAQVVASKRQALLNLPTEERLELVELIAQALSAHTKSSATILLLGAVPQAGPMSTHCGIADFKAPLSERLFFRLEPSGRIRLAFAPETPSVAGDCITSAVQLFAQGES